jgi:hypothetical protein
MQGAGKSVQLGLIAASLVASTMPAPSTSLHDAFNSQQAYAYTSEIAGLGVRWPGSPGHKETENLIHQVLQKDGAQIEADDFIATTPRGPVTVHNIIGKFNVSADPKQDIFVLAVTMTLSLRPDLSAQTTAHRARRFFWRLPMHLLTKRLGCKSGWSGPTWKRRSIHSEATTVSTGAAI